MKRWISHQTLDWSALPLAEQELRGRELFPLHQQIFGGGDWSEFLASVVHPAAEQSCCRLFYNQQHRLVGYCMIYRCVVPLNRRRYRVFRIDAGLLPDYRGQLSTLLFCLTQIYRYRLRHPFTPVLYFGLLIHPSSYHLLHRYLYQFYPRTGVQPPEELMQCLQQLAQHFEQRVINPADPWVYFSSWHTKEEQRFATAGGADIDFFTRLNPDYPQGAALAVLVPASWKNLVYALWRWLTRPQQREAGF